jgi:hypothetical protein
MELRFSGMVGIYGGTGVVFLANPDFTRFTASLLPTILMSQLLPDWHSIHFSNIKKIESISPTPHPHTIRSPILQTATLSLILILFHWVSALTSRKASHFIVIE